MLEIVDKILQANKRYSSITQAEKVLYLIFPSNATQVGFLLY